MSQFPFRRLLVGALGAALTLAVLVAVSGAGTRGCAGMPLPTQRRSP